MVEEKKEERKEGERKEEEEEAAHVDPIHPEDERGGKKKHLLSCEKTSWSVKRVADHNIITWVWQFDFYVGRLFSYPLEW